MPLNLLQMINRAEAELGLPQSATVIGNTQKQAIQMHALCNRVLDELRTMNRWTVCQFEYNLVVNPPIQTTGDVGEDSAVITNIPSTAGLVANYWAINANAVPQAARILSVDSATQITMTMEATASSVGTDLTFSQDTYPMPSDFEWFNNRTMWDRTNRWELLGPDSPQLDQWHRSGVVTTGPRRHFRQLGPYADRFRIWPPPTEITQPLQLVFEYLSLNAVVTADGTAYKQYFTLDTDLPLLSDQAIITGLEWMFWEVKGFNFAPRQNRWVDYINQLAARDGGAKTLSMTRRPNSLLITSASIPDGNWPS